MWATNLFHSCMYLGLFLDFLFWYINMYIYPWPVSHIYNVLISSQVSLPLITLFFLDFFLKILAFYFFHVIYWISLSSCLKFCWYFYLDDIKFISLIRENWPLYTIEPSYLRIRGAFIFCQVFFCALLIDIAHFLLTSFLGSLSFIIFAV